MDRIQKQGMVAEQLVQTETDQTVTGKKSFAELISTPTDTLPLNPTAGQVAYDSTAGRFKGWDGAEWQNLSFVLRQDSGLDLAGTNLRVDIQGTTESTTSSGSDTLLMATSSGIRRITVDNLLAGVSGGQQLRGAVTPKSTDPSPITSMAVIGDPLNSSISQGTSPTSSGPTANGYLYIVILDPADHNTGVTVRMGGPSGSPEDITVFDQDQLLWTGDRFTHLETGDSVIDVFGRSGRIIAQDGDYTASQVTNVPAGDVSSTNVQAAIDELDAEIRGLKDGSVGSGNADKLDGIDSTQFLRSDTNDTASGALTFTGNNKFTSVNNEYNGHHYFTAYNSAGNHYPHYRTGSDNTGAIVQTRVYRNGSQYRIFEMNGKTGDLSWDGQKVWHAGNDGSGSGLDADTVDGIEGADIVSVSSNQTVSGDKTFTGSFKISGTKWNTGRFIVEGAEPVIDLRQTDAGTWWKLGANSTNFYIMDDKTNDGNFDSPYALHLSATGVSTYGNAIWDSSATNKYTTSRITIDYPETKISGSNASLVLSNAGGGSSSHVDNALIRLKNYNPAVDFEDESGGVNGLPIRLLNESNTFKIGQRTDSNAAFEEYLSVNSSGVSTTRGVIQSTTSGDFAITRTGTANHKMYFSSNGATVISASNKPIYLRPQGSPTNSGAMIINEDGTVNTQGVLPSHDYHLTNRKYVVTKTAECWQPQVTVDLTAYPSTEWIPVYVSAGRENVGIDIESSGGGGSIPLNWNHIHGDFGNSGWSDESPYARFEKTMYDSSENTIWKFSRGTQGSAVVVAYLRGSKTYWIKVRGKQGRAIAYPNGFTSNTSKWPVYDLDGNVVRGSAANITDLINFSWDTGYDSRYSKDGEYSNQHGSVNYKRLNYTADVTGQLRTSRLMSDGRDFNGAAIRLLSQNTKNGTGHQSISFSTSTVDNWGWLISSERTGTDANGDFVISQHKDSEVGTSIMRFSDAANTIYNKLYLGGGAISSSSAALQVNGFMRTGSIIIHQGDTPTSSWDKLQNSNGNLQWGAKDLLNQARLVGSRTTGGNWALTGLRPYRPVIITMEDTGTTSQYPYCLFLPKTGFDNNQSSVGQYALRQSATTDLRSSCSVTLIPNATSATFSIGTVRYATLRAYQL